MDWGRQGNGFRGQSDRQSRFDQRGGYGGWGSGEGQGEYGGQGYMNQGQFSDEFGGTQYGQGYGQDYQEQGIGWQQGQSGGQRFGEQGRFGGWDDQEQFGSGQQRMRPSESYRGQGYGQQFYAGPGRGWQQGYEQDWGGQGRRFQNWGEGRFRGQGQSDWEHGRSGRGAWGQGYSGQEPWQQRQFGQGMSTQAPPEPATGFFYEEVWLIPGPQTGRGPRGYQRNDARIEEDICERLTHHGQIDASDIQVQVKGGEVTLTGTVESRQEKRMAEDLLDTISGVRDVHNQLRVQPRQDMLGQGQGQRFSGETSGEGQGIMTQGRGQSRSQAQRNEKTKAGAASS